MNLRAVSGCKRCDGAGYLVAKEGEFTRARLCGCVPTCPACEGAGWVPSDPSKPRSPRRPCECRVTSARLARLDEARVPGRYARSTFQSFATREPHQQQIKARVQRVVEEWVPGDDNRGVILYGDVGRGKTHLLCALIRELVMRHGVTARFIEFTILVAAIKATFNQDGPRSNLIDELVEVDVLAFDELGKGRNTEFEGQVLDEIVSRRYNAQRPIFGTTNHPPVFGQSNNGMEGLIGRIGERVFSRLRETTEFVQVPGNDFREFIQTQHERSP